MSIGLSSSYVYRVKNNRTRITPQSGKLLLLLQLPSPICLSFRSEPGESASVAAETDGLWFREL